MPGTLLSTETYYKEIDLFSPGWNVGGNVNETTREEFTSQDTARRILVLTAWISTLFGILYFLGLMGKLVVNGSIHAQSSAGISTIFAGVGLLWDMTLVILFVSLRRLITGSGGVYAELGLVFMALMAAISGANWYVQLMLVPGLEPARDAALLALLDVHNLGSVMYAMEHLAWGLFYGLATIFMGLAFQGSRMETWIRWLLVVGGVMSILYLPGILINNQALIDLGYYAAGVFLPVTTVLLAIRFRGAAVKGINTSAIRTF
jgi:hypothetical protein